MKAPAWFTCTHPRAQRTVRGEAHRCRACGLVWHPVLRHNDPVWVTRWFDTHGIEEGRVVKDSDVDQNPYVLIDTGDTARKYPWAPQLVPVYHRLKFGKTFHVSPKDAKRYVEVLLQHRIAAKKLALRRQLAALQKKLEFGVEVRPYKGPRGGS